MEKRFLTVREAEKFLNVKPSACRFQISEDRVCCALAGGRVLIDWLNLEEWAANGQLLENAERPGPDTERKVPRQDRKPEQMRFPFASDSADLEKARTVGVETPKRRGSGGRITTGLPRV